LFGLRANITPEVRPSSKGYVPTIAIFLWACLWCNLNTSFSPAPSNPNLADILLFIRGVVPFAVPPLAAFVVLRRNRFRLPKLSPSRLLMIYGAIAAISTVFSPIPFFSFYWSAAYFSTILAAWTFIDRNDPLGSAGQLLQVTWIATFIVAAIIGYEARGAVFGETANGYGVISELNGLSRSSGVARWAAVPGLVCLVRAYHTRRPSLLVFFLSASAISFFIVYRMQSRGAVFGAIGALLFALLVSSRMRRYALPFAVIAIVLILVLESPGTVSHHVVAYIQRGQTREEFFTLTGRTRAYEHSIVAIEEAPFLGRGQWADRLIIHEHVHNSFLQALLNAGIVGGIPYFASWVTSWLLFYKLQKRNEHFSPADRMHLLECGTIMMFFTFRAIPETTTASYAVDLLIMVAVYVYLESLTLQTKVKRIPKTIRPYHAIPLRTNRTQHPTGIVTNPQI
jgi:O-antigen ligase